jgi:hypothetical protein
VGTQALNDNAKKWDALTRDGAAVLHGLRVDQFDVPDADIADANARYKAPKAAPHRAFNLAPHARRRGLCVGVESVQRSAALHRGRCRLDQSALQALREELPIVRQLASDQRSQITALELEVIVSPQACK